MNSVYLSLGSNLRKREEYLKRALEIIGSNAGTIMAQSSLYETQPWKMDSATYFINQVVLLKTELTAQELLNVLMQIEKSMGRLRSSPSALYESRVIDIDILFYNNESASSPGLTIPHPLLHERRFVLMPMSELAPKYIHPVLQKSIEDLLYQCTDSSAVQKLS